MSCSLFLVQDSMSVSKIVHKTLQVPRILKRSPTKLLVTAVDRFVTRQRGVAAKVAVQTLKLRGTFQNMHMALLQYHNTATPASANEVRSFAPSQTGAPLDEMICQRPGT
jgi:hypothetical protein